MECLRMECENLLANNEKLFNVYFNTVMYILYYYNTLKPCATYKSELLLPSPGFRFTNDLMENQKNHFNQVYSKTGGN